MCGRFVQTKFMPPAKGPVIRNADLFKDLPDNFNFAPTVKAGAVLDYGEGLVADRIRWGLLPFWAKDAKLGYSTINARLESVDTKPAFREAFKRNRRCLIPMQGYYEWTGERPNKRAWYISDPGGQALWAAGLWEPPHKLLGEDAAPTFTIITRDAFGAPSDIHDRMPVLLELDQVGEWISSGADQAMSMLIASNPTLKVYEVGAAVGNVRNQGPQLIEPIAA